jgi:hypothetical protein
MNKNTLLFIGILVSFLVSLIFFIYEICYRYNGKKKKKVNEEANHDLSEGLADNPFDPLNIDYNLRSIAGSGTVCIVTFVYLLYLVFK